MVWSTKHVASTQVHKDLLRFLAGDDVPAREKPWPSHALAYPYVAWAKHVTFDKTVILEAQTGFDVNLLKRFHMSLDAITDLTKIPSDADTARAEDRINAADQEAAPAPEFGYIVDYRESDGMYRIVFDDIKDAEDANYWYKRDVDWYKRGVDFEVL